jgi:hypothetical protein
MPAAAKMPSARMARLTQMHQRRDVDVLDRAALGLAVVAFLTTSLSDELDDDDEEATNNGSSPFGAIYCTHREKLKFLREMLILDTVLYPVYTVQN